MHDGKSNTRTTLKDIARDVGISAMAVSKALNGKGGVSEETAQRIAEAARRLNYTPNTVAKSLRLNSTKTIGVVVSDSSYNLFARVIKGIEESAAAEGYSIILVNTDSDHEKEKQAVRVLVNKRIDGLILAASMLTKQADLDYIEGFGVPYVFVIRRPESDAADHVTNDNIEGARMMVKYLIGTGSRQIHFLNLSERSPSGRDRLEGYKKALAEGGIAYDPGLVSGVAPVIEEGCAAMRRLLDSGDDVSCVFCGCDITAIGAIDAILERGLRVPEDIRVAAYDDIDLAAHLRVPLTTVRQPKELIGQRGTELLIARIKGRGDPRPEHIILTPELVVRKSA